MFHALIFEPQGESYEDYIGRAVQFLVEAARFREVR